MMMSATGSFAPSKCLCCVKPSMPWCTELPASAHASDLVSTTSGLLNHAERCNCHCQVIDRALREDFGFEHLFWVYSGRRGVHCWVCDSRARKLSDEQRTAIVNYLTVFKGREKDIIKVGTGGHMHPSVQQAYDKLTEVWEQVIETSYLTTLNHSLISALLCECNKQYMIGVTRPSMSQLQPGILKVVRVMYNSRRSIAQPVLLGPQDILPNQRLLEDSKHMQDLLAYLPDSAEDVKQRVSEAWSRPPAAAQQHMDVGVTRWQALKSEVEKKVALLRSKVRSLLPLAVVHTVRPYS